MTIQSKKLITTLLVLMFCLAQSFAQTTIKEITDTFFSIYAKDPAKAIDYGFTTNKWMDIKQQDIVDLKTKIKSFVDQCGQFLGFELLSEKSAGENVKQLNFIVRYDREPLVFTFLFYRPDTTNWRLYNFSYTENLEADLK